MKSPEYYQAKHPAGSWWLLPVQVTAHNPIDPDDFSPRPLRLATKNADIDLPPRDLDTLLPFVTEEYAVVEGASGVYITHTRTRKDIARFHAEPDMEAAWNRAMQFFNHLQTETR